MFKQFRNQQKGIISIEFALLLPILLMFTMGIIELGMVFFAQVTLEGAVNAASRIAKTGQTTEGKSREQVVKDEVKRVAGGLMKPNDIIFSMTAYKDYNFTGGTNNSVGGAGDMVVIQATYNWEIVTPIIGQFFQNPYPIVARVAVRNEPF